MRAVVQRSERAAVSVSGETVGAIRNGLVVFLGISQEDDEKDADYLAEKIINLRIFEDNDGKFNLSCLDIRGQMLIISQFTLYGDCRKGRRPSFISAAEPEAAKYFYNYFVDKVSEYGIETATGEFGGKMTVEVENQGPVTMLLDSKKQF